MEINLRTDKYCIETGAKRAYEKLLKRYFKNKVDKNTKSSLEDQIEGLKTFLEQVDTKVLRNLYPELDVGGKTDVMLKVDSLGREMTLTFKHKEIKPPRKSFAAKTDKETSD
ncbi:MAG: hypothetical protein HN580_00365 [Deltaproteobacteria bacterium]|jgi:hypothetical protein|nr:hypothetical protein [Deltaproteobacteria bacterium]MBT4263770.1 hypothetical protein [Deltaproteobacteria bacterium]MBT4643331.1 hypothetical protein [Deltaproteobacteria bacterium]MBT6498698.1 hypothetical protein [Deltaproteobacteria bacterium]MBT7154631.1 hypothetical protein [Deltaproteobacteria bacterium]